VVVLALAGGIALAGSLGLPLIGSYNALAPTPQEYPAVAALPSPDQQRDPTPSSAMVMAKEPLEELADFLQQQRLLVEERIEVSQSEPATQEVAEYTVQPGDTLGMIAASKGVSPETLARANDITDADAIQIGQVLLIPPIDGVLTTVEEPTEASQSEPATQEVAEYTVQPGDTLGMIAASKGVSPETLAWANGITDAHMILVGQVLLIPPVDGVLHTVEDGDTISNIAARFGSTVDDIVAFNRLDSADAIRVGDKLVVPSGKPPVPPSPTPVAVAAAEAPAAEGPAAEAAPAPAAAPPPTPSAGLVWPTSGTLTQYYWSAHPAIDIAAPMGTPIYAAAAGVIVEELQWDYSYGWHIIIDHGNGVQTLYGHMSGFEVSLGQAVAQGQIIGYIGSTGYSTGPHCHFEVRVGGVAVDPLSRLP
jgi:murein DD-endopeptidase MepM/ murein hydrolase activator NlpD